MSKSLMLLQIPPEVTEHALILSHPCDVARFAQTCRTARSLVYDASDQNLWRQLFLAQPFDDLRKSHSRNGRAERVDWKGELQRRVRAEVLARNLADATSADRESMLETLISLVETAPPASLHDKAVRRSNTLQWLADLINDTRLLSTSTEHITPREEQLRCRLKTFVGLSEEEMSGADSHAMRTRARCFVYNLKNYSADNLWGAYMPDKSGRVDWAFLEAIMNTVSMNFHDLGNLWADTRPPVGLEGTRAYSAPGTLERDERDWAGVEGNWRRLVCFMDYRDLFAFNFSTSGEGPHDPTFFDNDDFQEAIRLIELDLYVVTVVEPTRPTSPPLPTLDSDSSDGSATPPPQSLSQRELYDTQRPTIHFAGTSRGGNGNEAKVKGTVKMTPDGQIRWRFVSASIYDGHTQWSSEGIQIGNVCSGAGVVGTWTGAHHEDGDPAGPFWLWKVPDDHPARMSALHG